MHTINSFAIENLVVTEKFHPEALPLCKVVAMYGYKNGSYERKINLS